MKSNRKNSKNRLFGFLFALSLVLTVYGLWAYYSPRIHRPYQLVSAIAYGTIKNFFFSSPLGAEADTTLAFEIAKWLAPITTSALVLTSLTNLAYHFLNTLQNRRSRNHMVIFGNNAASSALILNLSKEKSDIRLTLITPETLSDYEKQKLEKRGVAVYTASLKSTQGENDALAKKTGFSKARAFIFTNPDDLNNFSDFSALLKVLHPKQNVNCYVHCSSAGIRYFEDILNAELKCNDDLKMVDLIPFNQDELVIRMLMRHMQNRNGLLSRHFESLARYAEPIAADPLFRENGSPSEQEGIRDALGRIHLLVLGCNSLTAPLLFHTANDLQLSAEQNAKITILDPRAVHFVNEILSATDALVNALELAPVDVDWKNRRQLAEVLRTLSKDSDISTILFTSENTMDNLELLSIVRVYFPGTSFALRNTSGIELEQLLPITSNAFLVFGDIKKIMTQSIFLRRDIDKKARAFHESYSLASEKSNMGSLAPWNTLSQTKKESSRSSAVHGALKEEILRSYFSSKNRHDTKLSDPSKPDREIKKYLQSCMEEFWALRNETTDKPEEFQIRFTDYLKKHPMLDYLSRLEHRRWCNSYYVKNYRYAKVKDEIKLTHPCLIDDWNVLMREGFFTCHPEYDLLSVFALFSEEE